ncbi:MAG TPA: hypothetical protein VNR64_01955 [Vicinamibacterales bacterium]|nr:hypothetical protein [Vicinamibacterales bacterium]
MRRMCLMGLVLVLGLSACGRSRQYQPIDRESPLTLYEDPQSHECRIDGADVVRGFRGDQIKWPVSNHCSAKHTVTLVFADIPGADYELEHEVMAGAKYPLHIKVDKAPGSYKYSLQVDHSTQVDPRLEIDPY